MRDVLHQSRMRDLLVDEPASTMASSKSRLNIFAVILSFLLPFSVQDVSVTSAGQTLVLGGSYYFIPGYASGKLAKPVTASSTSGFVPITIVENVAAGADTSSVIASYLEKDDVLTTDFLQSKLVVYINSGFLIQVSLDAHKNASCLRLWCLPSLSPSSSPIRWKVSWHLR